MDLQTRKKEFIQAFLKLQSEEVIFNFKKLLLKESKIDSDVRPMTMKELNDQIQKSTTDSRNINLTESSKLISEIKKWS
ncbi:hypothetical protein J3S90_12840 [Flavobacterium sp. P4023]|uniref:Uncharacterized protein n=1 Tax=Flavobacterium flabelliforme TaxID=2816119 RepID=A0ABS5CVP6_9FLAO|nr:hypothetical protein [Flavobacterium flabelliforme]MBP4142687.1 hypothetical protein [Flavobacterium flabelliforme]